MASILTEGRQAFTDAVGAPLVGGKLYTYDAGTSTPRPTYADAAGAVPNTNPVVLDARGEATVFWSGAYKVVLKAADDSTIWTVDGVQSSDPQGAGAAAAQALRDDLASTAASKGASLVAVRDASAKFASTNVEAALEEVVGMIEATRAPGSRQIFSPWDYGASAAPGANNAAAIQACFTAALASGKDALISLWGDWSIASPITLTNAKNITIEGGRITLLPAFPSNRHAFEFLSTSDRSTERLNIRYTFVECSQITGSGGFRIEAGFKCTLYGCHVNHFKSTAYWIRENYGSHEVMIDSCWAMEYLYTDGAVAYTGPWTGTGFDIEPNDCKLDGCVSYFTGIPLRIDSQYNTVIGCHLGTGTVVLTSNASFCQLIGNYFDMCELRIRDPWHTKIQNNQFLHATSNASASFVTLVPSSANAYVYGLLVTGNTFQNNVATTMKSISVDLASGNFLAGGVGMCDVSSNTFVNTTKVTTRQRKRLFQGTSTSYAVTADQFPFGVVQHVVATFAPASAGVAVATGINVSGNTVTMTLASAQSGVAHVEMDCNVE